MIRTRQLVLVLLLGLFLRLGLSITVYSGDVNNHVEWGKGILAAGASGAYDREYPGVMQPTYPPLSLFSFTTASWAYTSVYNLSWALNRTTQLFPSAVIWALEDQDVLPAFFKLTSIFADLGIAVLIYALSRKVFSVSHEVGLIGAAVYLFNPAVFYNSALWGQMESPPVFCVMLAVWLLLTKRPLWGHAAFVCSLLFKQSSLVFTPLFLLLSLFKSGWKKTGIGLLIQLLIFVLAYLPFLPVPGQELSPINSQYSAVDPRFAALTYPFAVYLNRLEVGSGSNYISDHAFNLWAVFTRLEKIPDSTLIFAGLTADLFGKIIFVSISGWFIAKYLLSRSSRDLISLFGLISFFSFMFLTRMHERYLAPVLPFLGIVSLSKKQLIPIYFLVSLGHLINLYHEWWFPYISWLVPVISDIRTVNVVIILFTVSLISWSAVYFHAANKTQSA